MRTIFIQVTGEDAPVFAKPVTLTTFSIDSVHRDLADAALEFSPGDNVRCKLVRLRGPDEERPRQRLVAVERIR